MQPCNGPLTAARAKAPWPSLPKNSLLCLGTDSSKRVAASCHCSCATTHLMCSVYTCVGVYTCVRALLPTP